MRHRRLRLALRLGQRGARAAFLAAHHLPELVEVVQHGLSFQLFPESGGQLVVGGALVAELGVAERLAVALRDPDAVEDIAEGDGLAVGHVRVPALARVREADRPAVLDDVRQDHHLGHAGLLVHVRDVDLELAPARAEVPELQRGKLLARIAQHAVLGERIQGELELFAERGLERSSPSTLAPRVCPLGITLAIPDSAQPSARTVFSIAPTPSISQRTRSPGFRNPGGCMKKATPAGEPVTMMSPGNSVIAWLQ